MKRLLSFAVLAAILVTSSTTGCKRRRKTPESAVAETPTGPATMLSAADPRAAVQFTKGFYEVEDGQWRWSMRECSIALKPPATAASKGAVLFLKFVLPEASIQKLGPITLSAKIGNFAAASARYDKPGLYEYRADVPPSAFTAPMANIDFTLNKALPPGEVDQRELGMIVRIAGFEAK